MNGDQCSPRRAPVWPGERPHNGGPGHPSVRSSSSAHLQKKNTKKSSPPPPPLAPQISSSRLNRLFYFISLSSGERHRPTPSVSYPPSVSLSLRRAARFKSGLYPLVRTKQSHSRSRGFLIKLFMNPLQLD